MAASWLKAAAELDDEVKQYETQIKTRQESRGKMFRFWLEIGEKALITFVDGNLTPKGVLGMVSAREHNVFKDGHWGNYFICTEGVEGSCPICQDGNNAGLIAYLTIIDHRKFESKKEKGKIYTDGPKLFAATKDTVKRLQNIAIKRGGLAGCTFEVTRIGDKNSSRVGTDFEFIEKNDPAVLVKKFTKVVEDEKTKQKKIVSVFVPANYEQELGYKSSDELRQLGFGKGAGAKIGGEKPLTDDTSTDDLNKHL